MALRYTAYTGPDSGVAQVAASSGMSEHMAAVGQQAVGVAHGFTDGPVTSEVVFTGPVAGLFARWRVNVTNTAADAVQQEFGTAATARTSPMGRLLDVIIAAYHGPGPGVE